MLIVNYFDGAGGGYEFKAGDRRKRIYHIGH